jgi:peptidase A4-like protein
MRGRLILTSCITVAALVTATAATASTGSAATAKRVVGLVRGAHAGLNMSQSNNWSGYNKGVLETGTPFQSISGTWVVPTATAHKKGEDEFSSTWVGIGGGCLDTSCLATDETLIQAGTEQDVAADGTASYSTWFELIPAPSISTPLAVRPGDTVKVDIGQTVPEVWTITITDVSSGQNFTTTVPYPSTYGTAEWVEETPLLIGTNAGFSAMPNLGNVQFSGATVNGANAGLQSAEAIQLVDPNGTVLATPSAPNATRDGFTDCTYATTC